jgi:hypothetical protein
MHRSSTFCKLSDFQYALICSIGLAGWYGHTNTNSIMVVTLPYEIGLRMVNYLPRVVGYGFYNRLSALIGYEQPGIGLK